MGGSISLQGRLPKAGYRRMTAIIFVRLLAVGSSADEYEMDAVMPLQGCFNEYPREPCENLLSSQQYSGEIRENRSNRSIRICE